MKFLFDLFPVILFFVVYQAADIWAATAAAILATFAQVGWLKLRRRRVEPMLWASLAIIVVFGGATLVLHEEWFIKWKPTVLYWLFAGVLAAGQLVFRRNLMQAMLAGQLEMPRAGWARLTWSWTGFFVFMGAVNLYVAYAYSTDVWVSFKLFGGIGLMLVFVIGQAFWLARFVEEKE